MNTNASVTTCCNAVQVESARADLMGVSFGIDFSGSTNFVLLSPGASSIETHPPIAAAAAPTESADSGSPRQEQSASCAAVVSTAESCDPVGNKGDKSEKIGAPRTAKGGEETASEAGRNDEEGDAVAGWGGGAGEVLQGMSARVSTGAFCRATVARVAVRDPKAGGTIKVGKVFRADLGVRCCSGVACTRCVL